MKDVLIVFLCFLLFLVSACTGGASMVAHHNEEIADSVRAEVHRLTDSIIASFADGRVEVMRDLYVEGAADEARLPEFYGQMKGDTDGVDFGVMDDYLVRCTGVGTVTFPVASGTEHGYTLTMPFEGGKSYFVSLVSSKGAHKGVLLTFVYVEDGGAWRLQYFGAGILRIGGRDAIDWYDEAREIALEGHVLPALLRLQMVANSLLRPATFMRYDKEGEVLGLFRRLDTRFREEHPFPVRLDGVETAPSVYLVQLTFVEGNALPLVHYVSSMSPDDPGALQREAEAMTPLLEAMFPGITTHSNHIAFRAYAEAPTDPSRSYPYYGITVEL